MVKLVNLGCGNRYHADWINLDFIANFPGVIPCNLRRGLPFRNGSIDVVYHSHVLEHFSKRAAPIFLSEVCRVLKPGGIMRVVVPDFEQTARLYLSLLEAAAAGDVIAKSRYEWIILEMLDQMVRNQSGGEMFSYWSQNPMPAEDFVIERVGSEVLNALKWMRDPANRAYIERRPVDEGDSGAIGRFRTSGEIHQWMYDRYSLRELLERTGFEAIRTCRADESVISDFNSYLLDLEPDGRTRKPESLFMEARKAGEN